MAATSAPARSSANAGSARASRNALNAIAALGLGFEVVNPQDQRSGKLDGGEKRLLPSTVLRSTIRLTDCPQLQRLAWQRHGVAEVTPTEALALYERNWRHVDLSAMEPRERTLVDALASELAGGRLLV